MDDKYIQIAQLLLKCRDNINQSRRMWETLRFIPALQYPNHPSCERFFTHTSDGNICEWNIPNAHVIKDHLVTIMPHKTAQMYLAALPGELEFCRHCMFFIPVSEMHNDDSCCGCYDKKKKKTNSCMLSSPMSTAFEASL